ncbi:MAG: hypothetical protein MK052_09065 [Alphaproteobacteria bacterium]|nr:hypothetical protein [Alphaproteobacteria bacterium]
MKFLKWIGTILLFLLLSIGGFLWYMLHPEPIDPECFARDVVLVKIGETHLAVPREYRPVFHAPDGKSIPYADRLTMTKVCQRENDSPLEVKSIWISPKNKPGKFKYLSLSTYRPVNKQDNYHVFKYWDIYAQYPFHAEDHEITKEQYEGAVLYEIKFWQKFAKKELGKKD